MFGIKKVRSKLDALDAKVSTLETIISKLQQQVDSAEDPFAGLFQAANKGLLALPEGL